MNNIEKLFEIQGGLDAHIVKKHPEAGESNWSWKELALQTELAECANEWRGFKKWSNDQEPRNGVTCHACEGEGLFSSDEVCTYCDGTGEQENRLLEEYVDCLHFILSIGLNLKTIQNKPVESFNYYGFQNPWGIQESFSDLMAETKGFYNNRDNEEAKASYGHYFCEFIGLGEMLGFDWQDVEDAYFRKNNTNHQRQLTGY